MNKKNQLQIPVLIKTKDFDPSDFKLVDLIHQNADQHLKNHKIFEDAGIMKINMN